ncbi:disease resistance protein RPS6 [Trifolium repens]|nr:disease resistance protein RPS6 [Trifolium repens]
MASFTTNPNRKSYDVYLSFCDEDAGPFVSRLYTAISSEDGIIVFWDNDRLGSGEIPTSMLSVIGHCQIAIIVFSINYANSRRCLQELEKITKCSRTSNLIVLPVFYDGVYPSNGSLKSVMFGEAFHDFVDRISEEDDKFMDWVAGISKAYKYSGPRYFLVIDIYSEEIQHIKNVVDRVTCVLNKRINLSSAFYTRESSNMTNQPKMYDVFLSFRGEDNRAKFIAHLYSSLQNAGIYAFRDAEIQRGDLISISLLQAIGRSRISIIVLSINYANSRWCMLELEKIMEIGRTRDLVVVPVFYEVDPSEVRHQDGQFGKAFEDLISTISVDESTKSNWRRELFNFGGIAGFVLIGSRNESEDIKNIVEHVTHLLDRTELFVAEHPVGVESRVEAATKLLNIKKKDVLLLGIWGMGDPEKRSRLWCHEEVFDVLAKCKGTEAVKGLALEFPKKDCLETKAFENMNKLRLLRLAAVKLKGDFQYLSGDLRWLYWHGFPETYTPAEFRQESLVAIELKYSKLKQIWNKSQMLENLKILNLSHSLDLTETPDFTYLPNLEKLVLKNCPSLSKISHSIGSLSKLLMINLTDCTGLRKLPRSIYKLKSLETLIISGCSNIDKLEEDLEQMESLITLIADKTGITKVPFSIVRLKSIGYISFNGVEGFSRDVFPSLIRSWMSPSLGTLKDLLKLRSLCVECGSYQQLTQDVSRILDVLKATNCQKLETSASASTSQISNMYVSPIIDDCLSQGFSSGSKNYLKSLLIQMGSTHKFPNIAKDNFLQTSDGTLDSFLHPCDNNYEWSTFSCKGCSIIFDLPTMKGNSLKSMTLFVVYYSSPDNETSEGFQGMVIINYTKTTMQVYKRDAITSIEEEEWQSVISNLEPGNKVGVMFVFGEGFTVEKITVSLLYNEALNKEMEHCHVVDEEDISGGGDINVPTDNNVTCPSQSENISEDKHRHEVDENASVSGDDAMKSNTNYAVSVGSDMPTDKKVIISSKDENRFCGLFNKLPSFVRAVLMSRPFWSGLVVILLWITCRHFKKRSPNLLTRYIRRGKWLVDCAQKLITYKKANEAYSHRQLQT